MQALENDSFELIFPKEVSKNKMGNDNSRGTAIFIDNFCKFNELETYQFGRIRYKIDWKFFQSETGVFLSIINNERYLDLDSFAFEE